MRIITHTFSFPNGQIKGLQGLNWFDLVPHFSLVELMTFNFKYPLSL